MTPEAKLRAISELRKSKGWQIIREMMESEIGTFTLQMSSAPAMSEDELHWRRGVLYASQRFLGLPEVITQLVENDVILTQSTSSLEKKDKLDGNTST